MVVDVGFQQWVNQRWQIISDAAATKLYFHQLIVLQQFGLELSVKPGWIQIETGAPGLLLMFCLLLFLLLQTLQMGIRHFSGLFMLLCIGVGGALLTLAGEHGFYQLVLPHIRRRQNLKYWLHTSQVRPTMPVHIFTSCRMSRWSLDHSDLRSEWHHNHDG